MDALPRLLALPPRSFFVFGPRGVGKCLLRSEVSLDLARDPSLLEAKVGRRPAGSWVCIDEVL